MKLGPLGLIRIMSTRGDPGYITGLYASEFFHQPRLGGLGAQPTNGKFPNCLAILPGGKKSHPRAPALGLGLGLGLGLDSGEWGIENAQNGWGNTVGHAKLS